MAVLKGCHQTLLKVLLKSWLSSKAKENIANLQRLDNRLAKRFQIFKDQRKGLVILWWGDGVSGVFVVVWWCFCVGALVFLCWCGGVFVVMWW